MDKSTPTPPAASLVEELAESVRLALRLPYKGEIAHALSQHPRFVRAAKLLAAVERPEPSPLLNRIASICGKHRMSPTGAADAGDDLRRDPMVADAAERLARLEAIVALLPKTVDGVPIVPGSVVWSVSSGKPYPFLIDNIGRVDEPDFDDGAWGLSAAAKRGPLYSTEDALLESMNAKEAEANQ